MQFVADFWWLWCIALVLSAAFLVRRMFGHVRNPSSMLDGDMKGIFMSFVPVWAFGALFLLSIVLNVIRFAQSG
jgi:hypothetical protein